MFVSSPLRSVGAVARRVILGRAFATAAARSSAFDNSNKALPAVIAAAAAAAATLAYASKTYLESRRPPVGGDVIVSGTPVKEPSTGILFPPLCNGYNLAGTGVRVKYGFVKVYAVGTYVDPLALSVVKNNPNALEEALMDPTYPRTIRIVMNRGLSVDKFTAGIVESLEPRMKNQDLDKLEEFKKLNPPVDLVKGAEIEMTIRGDTLLYKNAVGGVGTIHSRAFTTALCDTYFGPDPVSPTHKAAVLEGIPKL